jgi:hypothetical protein
MAAAGGEMEREIKEVKDAIKKNEAMLQSSPLAEWKEKALREELVEDKKRLNRLEDAAAGEVFHAMRRLGTCPDARRHTASLQSNQRTCSRLGSSGGDLPSCTFITCPLTCALRPAPLSRTRSGSGGGACGRRRPGPRQQRRCVMKITASAGLKP